MKIIFLDIDGVLNTNRYVKYQVENKMVTHGQAGHYNFDPETMKNLQSLTLDFDAHIVISSTWRIFLDNFDVWKTTGDCGNKYKDWPALVRNLREYNIEDRLIGVTKRLNPKYSVEESLKLFGSESVPRGAEIKLWLKENKHLNVTSFVILDDDSDMMELTDTHLAKCKNYYGFIEEPYNKAKIILSSNNMIEI